MLFTWEKHHTCFPEMGAIFNTHSLMSGAGKINAKDFSLNKLNPRTETFSVNQFISALKCSATIVAKNDYCCVKMSLPLL